MLVYIVNSKYPIIEINLFVPKINNNNNNLYKKSIIITKKNIYIIYISK